MTVLTGETAAGALSTRTLGSSYNAASHEALEDAVLVIAGHIRLDPARKRQATAIAVEVMEATREEPGCLSYTFSADLEDEGLIHLFEEWESQDALDAHFQTPHMARFQAEVPNLGVKELAVKRYEIASVGPLGARR